MMGTSDIVLEDRLIRIIFRREKELFVDYEIFAQSPNDEGGRWRKLGVGLFADFVAHVPATRKDERIPVRPELVPDTSSPRTVAFRARMRDSGGARWTMEFGFSLAPVAGQVDVTSALSVDADAGFRLFRAPTIYAGRECFGGRKDDALFPGLEYLLGDEQSSGSENAAEQYRRRYTVHPYKVTIPMMAVSQGGAAVGLFWDPNQDWYRRHRHPAPVFASPDTFEDSDDHLMGLFIPNVPKWSEENARMPGVALGLKAGDRLRLSATIAAAGGDSLALLRSWVSRHGLPPLPETGMTYEDDVDLCVRSFVEVTWDAEARGWHSALVDPYGPRFDGGTAAELLRYSQTGRDPELRRRAAEVVREAASSLGDKDVPLEFAFHGGRLAESLTAAQRHMERLIAGQREDGSWPFTPREERHEKLGKRGDTSSGQVAAPAARILRHARITGDEKSLAAGLRALEYLNRLPRPEGAQVWELQLHVPDVLAAAHAVSANIEARRVTGENRFIEQARRWAWSGLPFVYLWDAWYRPIMAYGSIPTFGVTWFDSQPWFGVLVQWNGLAYAEALFDLARFDGSFGWSRIAEGLTRCGIQQQVKIESPVLGMYPDAYSVVKGDEEYHWWLSAGWVARNAFPLAGIHVAPDTWIARAGDGPVHVTSGARVSGIEAGRGSVRFRLTYAGGSASHTLLAGPGSVGEVRVGGRIVPRVEDVDQQDEGWQQVANMPWHVVKLRHEGDLPREVQCVL